MATLSHYLARLGSPDAINWLSVVAVMVFQTCASLITSGVNFDQQFALFLAVRIGSLVAFIAVLALGKRLLVVTTHRRTQPLVTLATFVVGIVASTSLFDWLLVVTGLADESFLARRIILSLVGATVILIMVALTVTTARDYAALNRGLADTIREISSLRATTAKRIQQRRDDLVATIHDLINDHLTHASLPGSQAEGVMGNLIDDVIRPLSHALGKQPAPARDTASASSPSIPWRQVVRGVLQGRPYSPFAFPGAIGAIIATFLVMSFGLLGAGVTVAVFIAAALLNILLGVVWRVIPGHTPLSIRFVVFTLSVAPFLWFSVVFIATTTSFNLAASPVRLSAWTLMVIGTWWVAALATSVFDQLKTTNAQLEDVLADLKTELAALNATDHALRKNISRVLHGPIQEAVASSLRKLHASPELATEDGFFDALRQKIQTALDSLDVTTTSPIDLGAELEDLQEVWEGSVTIETVIADDALTALTEHPTASHILLELIREACQNAIKHGDADTIRISLDIDQETPTAHLEITNSGAPLPHSSRPGIGSALFDDLTISWTRNTVPEGVRVSGVVPLR